MWCENNVRFALFSTIFSIISLYLVRYFWRRRRLYYYASKMPGAPAWPIIGNALYFAGGTADILDNIMYLLNTYKSPQRVWLGQRLFFGIGQPKDLEIIMNQALDKEQLYDFTRPVVGTGLFSGPIEKWRRHRKVILPTFNQKNLNSFVEIFAEHSKILVEKLEKFDGKGIFDIHPLLSKCAVETVCETAMGRSMRGQTDEFVKGVARALEIVYMRMFQIWMHPEFIFKLTNLSKELDQHCANINQFLRTLVQSKKKEYRYNKEHNLCQEDFHEVHKKKAFLDYLVELSEEGANWTDDELIEETATVMIGGSDSTGNTGGFALIMLGMHPQLQDKVHEEIFEIFGSSDRSCTPEDLSRMVYLERFLKETLRLFPVGPAIVRRLEQDVQLDSYLLPKGSSCVLGILYTHRNPDLWPDPLKFDPDRFLPEEIAKRHPYAFVPFSAGPRNCIGPKYGMMSMKTLISSIVRHFVIATNYKRVEDVKVKADLMLKAANGWTIQLKSRINKLS